MWICPKCEHENSDNQSKCSICGVEIYKVITSKVKPVPQKRKMVPSILVLYWTGSNIYWGRNINKQPYTSNRKSFKFEFGFT